MEKKKFDTVEFTGHWDSNNYDRKELKDELFKTLRHTRLNNGVTYASVGKSYMFKAWIRDMVNCALPELKENPAFYVESIQAMLDFYIDCEKEYEKFTKIIENPHNKQSWEFPHPRLNKHKKEIHSPWGYRQWDSLGLLLYSVYLAESNKIKVIRGEEDRKIIQLIIDMFQSIRVETYPDNGCWEESEKIESSSLGAVLAGLSAVKLLKFRVDQGLLDRLHNSLNILLTKESHDRDVDLAQLSLIYPLNILDPFRAKQIIANVEAKLLGYYGCQRYYNDQYFNPTGLPEDSPHWCFALSYLGLSYLTLGNKKEAERYARMVIDRTILKGVKMPYIDKETGEAVDGKYVISNAAVPEMFIGDKPNENTPLQWSNSFAILLLRETGFID